MVKVREGILWLAVASVTTGGCATVDPQHDYRRAGQHVTAATGQEHVYNPGDDTNSDHIAELLDGGITAVEAVQVCLLGNPTLQAAFFDIGMARADVVQAGLLSNPALSIAVQLPSGGGLANLEAGLAGSIADLWQIPARKRSAQRSLDATILEVARQATELAADAKAAYYEAVGADEHHRIAEQNLAVARNLLELGLARQEAGAANELEVNLSRSLSLEAEAESETARLVAAEARRSLATLLGVTSDAADLVLLDPLPEPPKAPDAHRLLDMARSWRLDMRAARQAVRAAEARLQEEYRRVLPTVELGIALERGERERSAGGRDLLADTARASIANGALTAPGIEPRSNGDRHTDFIIGPSLDIELPIFDQNQAQIARARFTYEQASRTLEALDRAAAQEVRGAVDRALTAWNLVHLYRDRFLPLAQNNLDLSREAYRAGRASFLSVLEAQRFFLASRRDYVRAAQTAATMIPQLERTIGLPYDKLVAEVDAEEAPETETPEETDQ